MTREEFGKLSKIINDTMGKLSFLVNEDLQDTFWNFCVPYPYDVAKKAVIDLIEREAYDTEGRRVPLSLYLVERKIEREQVFRRSQEQKRQEQEQQRTCPNCGNRGYIMTRYPTGVEYFRACGCKVGREKYPWFFKTDADRQNDGDEGARRSWAAYEAFRAPVEFHRQEKYGK